jgi:hypothetical protein
MKTLVRLRCRDCGYGVSVRAAPAACPMCHGVDWEHEPWRPFSAFVHDVQLRGEPAPRRQRLPK